MAAYLNVLIRCPEGMMDRHNQDSPEKSQNQYWDTYGNRPADSSVLNQ